MGIIFGLNVAYLLLIHLGLEDCEGRDDKKYWINETIYKR